MNLWSLSTICDKRWHRFIKWAAHGQISVTSHKPTQSRPAGITSLNTFTRLAHDQWASGAPKYNNNNNSHRSAKLGNRSLTPPSLDTLLRSYISDLNDNKYRSKSIICQFVSAFLNIFQAVKPHVEFLSASLHPLSVILSYCFLSSLSAFHFSHCTSGKHVWASALAALLSPKFKCYVFILNLLKRGY